MFESIRQDYVFASMARTTSLAVSLAAHAALVATLIIVPLFLIEGLSQEGILTVLFVDKGVLQPDVPVPPVSLGPSASGSQEEGASVFRIEIPVEEWQAPNAIPHDLPPPSDEGPILTGLNVLPVNGSGIAGYYSGVDRVVSELLPVKSADMPLPEKPPEKKVPVRIGRLEPSRLIFKLNPAYPELAKIAGVSGEVDLEAVIDEVGNVTEVKIIKGHPLLCEAAAEAVKKWKYTPTVQNGEPIPVLAYVKIIFRID